MGVNVSVMVCMGVRVRERVRVNVRSMNISNILHIYIDTYIQKSNPHCDPTFLFRLLIISFMLETICCWSNADT